MEGEQNDKNLRTRTDKYVTIVIALLFICSIGGIVGLIIVSWPDFYSELRYIFLYTIPFYIGIGIYWERNQVFWTYFIILVGLCTSSMLGAAISPTVVSYMDYYSPIHLVLPVILPIQICIAIYYSGEGVTTQSKKEYIFPFSMIILQMLLSFHIIYLESISAPIVRNNIYPLLVWEWVIVIWMNVTVYRELKIYKKK